MLFGQLFVSLQSPKQLVKQENGICFPGVSNQSLPVITGGTLCFQKWLQKEGELSLTGDKFVPTFCVWQAQTIHTVSDSQQMSDLWPFLN